MKKEPIHRFSVPPPGVVYVSETCGGVTITVGPPRSNVFAFKDIERLSYQPASKGRVEVYAVEGTAPRVMLAVAVWASAWLAHAKQNDHWFDDGIGWRPDPMETIARELARQAEVPHA